MSGIFQCALPQNVLNLFTILLIKRNNNQLLHFGGIQYYLQQSRITSLHRDTKPYLKHSHKTEFTKEALNANSIQFVLQIGWQAVLQLSGLLIIYEKYLYIIVTPFQPGIHSQIHGKKCQITVCKERPSNGSKYFLKSFITKFR